MDDIITALRSAANGSCGLDEAEEMALLSEAADVIERLREALMPSVETKAAYIGEFKFSFPMTDEYGEEYSQPINVPWTTIKEIMAAIRAYAEASVNRDTESDDT